MFQTNVVKKIKTHILCSVTFSVKLCRLWDNVEKFGKSRQATALVESPLFDQRSLSSSETDIRSSCHVWHKVYPLVSVPVTKCTRLSCGMQLPQNFPRIGNGALWRVAGTMLSVGTVMPRPHERRTFQAPALLSNVNRLSPRVDYVAPMMTEAWESCKSRNSSFFVLCVAADLYGACCNVTSKTFNWQRAWPTRACRPMLFRGRLCQALIHGIRKFIWDCFASLTVPF
jgi:hypothetical protein